MKTHPTAQALRFFEVDLRVTFLEVTGNSSSRFDAAVAVLHLKRQTKT